MQDNNYITKKINNQLSKTSTDLIMFRFDRPYFIIVSLRTDLIISKKCLL